MLINGKKVDETSIERFWTRVDIGSSDDCWEWQAGKNSRKKGYDYGIFWIHGKGILTHRLALSFHLGYWIDSDEVLHTCDNCPCCNPKHLVEGTHLDNMRDMNKKGRRVCERGEARHSAKLTEEKVREIRKLGARGSKFQRKLVRMQQELVILEERIKKLKSILPKYTMTRIATKYKVDRVVIAKIIRREAWKHVED